MECTREWDNSHTTIHPVEPSNTQPGCHACHPQGTSSPGPGKWSELVQNNLQVPAMPYPGYGKTLPHFGQKQDLNTQDLAQSFGTCARREGSHQGLADFGNSSPLTLALSFPCFVEWKNTCPTPPSVFTGNPPCFDSFSDILLHLGEAVGKPQAVCEGASSSPSPAGQAGRLGCGSSAALAPPHLTQNTWKLFPPHSHRPLARPPHPTGMHRGATTLHSLVALTPQC